MRVHASRETGRRPRFGHPVRALRFVRVGDVEDAERPLYAGGSRAADHRFEIVRERGVGQMAVRIDHESGLGS